MSLMLPALLVLLCVAQEPLELNTRVSTGPEADSNARRQTSGQVPRADLLWRSHLELQMAQQAGQHRLMLESQVGVKQFLREQSEDLGVVELRVRQESRWLPWLGTFVEGVDRDRRQRSGQRDYHSLVGNLGVTLGPWLGVQVVVGTGPRAFLLWPDPRFHHAGGGLFTAGIVRITDAEMLALSGGLDARVFPWGAPATGHTQEGERTFNEGERRVDGSGFGEISVESARVLYVRGAYRLLGNLSNSHGEGFLRHRLGLTVGGLLPGGVRILVEGQLQATRWPQGLGLGERLALQEADENQTHAGARLNVPVGEGVWLESRLAAYTAELSAVRTPFMRYTAMVGLSYRLGRAGWIQ